MVILNSLFWWQANSSYTWRELVSLNLSGNSITEVHPAAVHLVPKLRSLDLSHNSLSSWSIDLSSLSDLEELDLSYNRIAQLPDLHTKLGNLKSLRLAQNKLTVLDGLAKLYGLVTLDVRSNRIAELDAVRAISSLPCLEDLTLTGNPVTTVLDFRTKVFTLFGTFWRLCFIYFYINYFWIQFIGSRASEVCLDNERPMQKELDTVAILLALNAAKKLTIK